MQINNSFKAFFNYIGSAFLNGISAISQKITGIWSNLFKKTPTEIPLTITFNAVRSDEFMLKQQILEMLNRQHFTFFGTKPFVLSKADDTKSIKIFFMLGSDRTDGVTESIPNEMVQKMERYHSQIGIVQILPGASGQTLKKISDGAYNTDDRKAFVISTNQASFEVFDSSCSSNRQDMIKSIVSVWEKVKK